MILGPRAPTTGSRPRPSCSSVIAGETGIAQPRLPTTAPGVSGAASVMVPVVTMSPADDRPALWLRGHRVDPQAQCVERAVENDIGAAFLDVACRRTTSATRSAASCVVRVVPWRCETRDHRHARAHEEPSVQARSRRTNRLPRSAIRRSACGRSRSRARPSRSTPRARSSSCPAAGARAKPNMISGSRRGSTKGASDTLASALSTCSSVVSHTGPQIGPNTPYRAQMPRLVKPIL